MLDKLAHLLPNSYSITPIRTGGFVRPFLFFIGGWVAARDIKLRK
jgi:hypothetical protein